MRTALIAGAVLILSGCNRSAEPQMFQPGTIDCDKGFGALVAELDSSTSLIADRRERGLNAYRDDRAGRLYLVTLPDHPAHPAIFLRHLIPTLDMMMIDSEGCGFGDKEAFDREMRAYRAFDRLLNAEEPCYDCTPDRLTSPSVHRRTPPPPGGW